jgi:hypothetical protein
MGGVSVRGVMVTTISLIAAIYIYDRFLKGNLP